MDQFYDLEGGWKSSQMDNVRTRPYSAKGWQIFIIYNHYIYNFNGCSSTTNLDSFSENT